MRFANLKRLKVAKKLMEKSLLWIECDDMVFYCNCWVWDGTVVLDFIYWFIIYLFVYLFTYLCCLYFQVLLIAFNFYLSLLCFCLFFVSVYLVKIYQAYIRISELVLSEKTSVISLCNVFGIEKELSGRPFRNLI